MRLIDADALVERIETEKKPHPMGWRAWSAKPTEEQMKEVPWE